MAGCASGQPRPPFPADELPADIAADIEVARQALDGSEVDYEATMEVGLGRERWCWCWG